MFKLSVFTFLIIVLFNACSNEPLEITQSKPSDAPLADDTILLPPPNTADNIHLLLVRLEYNNAKFTQNTLTWSNKIFGSEPHQLNNYYGEISAGQFSFQRLDETEGVINDGIITIELPKDHPDSGSSSSIHPDLKEALTLTDPYVDYSAYDTNADGHLSYDEIQVVFIVAGNEDAYSGETSLPGVWAHQDCTSTANTPTLDGVTLMQCSSDGAYALFGERHSDYDDNGHYLGSHDASIGIIAHELGHSTFKLPDLYDTDDSSAGIGYFGLMSGGTWGYAQESEVSGYTPTHMCAWSKIHNGWVSPTLASNVNANSYTLNASALESMDIIKIPTQNTKEYFLIENRHKLGYDKGLYAIDGNFIGGLAIWHIDEQIIDSKYSSNTIQTNEAHKGIDLEEALNARLDISPYEHGDAKNLYHRFTQRVFSTSSTPNSQLYDGGESAISVQNISAVSSTMTLTITNPN